MAAHQARQLTKDPMTSRYKTKQDGKRLATRILRDLQSGKLKDSRGEALPVKNWEHVMRDWLEAIQSGSSPHSADAHAAMEVVINEARSKLSAHMRKREHIERQLLTAEARLKRALSDELLNKLDGTYQERRSRLVEALRALDEAYTRESAHVREGGVREVEAATAYVETVQFNLDNMKMPYLDDRRVDVGDA